MSHERSTKSDAAERLARLKASVPAAIASVGRHRWHQLVDRSAPTVPLPPHAISRAYAKLKEIMLTCALPLPSRSLHLGEAPGGFVQCVGDLVDQRGGGAWRWLAVSLREGPQFDEERLPMSRGSIRYADMLVHGDGFGRAEFDLVTADGACEMNHDHLEAEHLLLFDAQCAIACGACAPGGTVVVKFYEGACADTLRVVAAVSRCFARLSVLKPRSSRAVNSERYLVGRDRLAHEVYDAAAFPAPAWLADTAQVLDELIADQIEALGKILSTVKPT